MLVPTMQPTIYALGINTTLQGVAAVPNCYTRAVSNTLQSLTVHSLLHDHAIQAEQSQQACSMHQGLCMHFTA